MASCDVRPPDFNPTDDFVLPAGLGKCPHAAPGFPYDDHVNAVAVEQLEHVGNSSFERAVKRLRFHHLKVDDEEGLALTVRGDLFKVTDSFVHVCLLVFNQGALPVGNLLCVMPAVNFNDETQTGLIFVEFVETSTGADVPTDSYLGPTVGETSCSQCIPHRVYAL